MVILDVSIVNVALPSIRGGLHFGTTGLQWVVNAYTITFGGFLLLGGRAADLLGRRRVFLAGTALFSVGSLLCALAMLARPADRRARAAGPRRRGALAREPLDHHDLFHRGPRAQPRARRVGRDGGLGGASGALFGGLLTQGLGWPAIFLINVPIGAAVIVAGRRVIPESRREDLATAHFDVAGAMLVTLGLIVARLRDRPQREPRLGLDRSARPARARRSRCSALFALVEGRFARRAAAAAVGLRRCRGCAPPTS